MLSGEAGITTAAFNIGESHFTLLDTANLQWQNAQLNVDSLILAGKDGRFVLNGQLFDTEAPELELGLEDFNSRWSITCSVLQKLCFQVHGMHN